MGEEAHAKEVAVRAEQYRQKGQFSHGIGLCDFVVCGDLAHKSREHEKGDDHAAAKDPEQYPKSFMRWEMVLQGGGQDGGDQQADQRKGFAPCGYAGALSGGVIPKAANHVEIDGDDAETCGGQYHGQGKPCGRRHRELGAMEDSGHTRDQHGRARADDGEALRGVFVGEVAYYWVLDGVEHADEQQDDTDEAEAEAEAQLTRVEIRGVYVEG